MKSAGWGAKSILIAGFTFLYLPILLLMVYSFNESRLVTVWGGFSLQWYIELFQDERLMRAVGMSLQVAVLSATGATLLGLLAGLVIVRMHEFRGRTLFVSLITAPLVMPEVITGLSLLLLFVTLSDMIGWPEGRGLLTIWIAHVTFASAYVAVVISSRLRGFEGALEEAAMDLGAPPLKAFLLITLPLIMPAILSGWLLAFTLSLDDLVIASFVSGPSSTTLPMEVFSSVRRGVSPKINALATLLVLAVAIAGVIAWWTAARSDARRQEEMRLAERAEG